MYQPFSVKKILLNFQKSRNKCKTYFNDLFINSVFPLLKLFWLSLLRLLLATLLGTKQPADDPVKFEPWCIGAEFEFVVE